MNIFKAFLFTVLLVIIELIINVSMGFLIDAGDWEFNLLVHYVGLSQIIPYTIAFSILLFLIFKMKIQWDNGIEKINNVRGNIIFYLLILNVGLFIYDRPFFDFTRILDTINNVPIEPYENYQGSNIAIFYKSISVLILAPIFEELFFRKYLFVELQKKYSQKISILISSICFSLVHLPSYRNLIPTFLFGIFCCIIYTKTKNIFYTIFLHFLLNLTWLLAINFGADYYNWILSLGYNFIYWLLVFLGVLIVLFGLRKINTVNEELS